MEKRYQVFVSSTYEDLIEERREVMVALMRLNCIPTGMELFPAADDEQLTLIKKTIDESDYYLLIAGGRYGSIEPSSGKSYTQVEFEYAVSRQKPIISFVHKKPDSLPPDRQEGDPESKKKLTEFLDVVRKKNCDFWIDKNELKAAVYPSVINLKSMRPSTGWVPGNLVVDEKSLSEQIAIRKENESLKKQLKALENRPPKDSSEYAQGSDPVSLDYFAQLKVYNAPSTGAIVGTIWKSFETTWDVVFAWISPTIGSGCMEALIIQRLADLAYYYNFTSTEAEVQKDGKKVHKIGLSKNSIEDVIIQLRALGLIEKSAIGWALTSLGEKRMISLRAKKKPVRPSSIPKENKLDLAAILAGVNLKRTLSRV